MTLRTRSIMINQFQKILVVVKKTPYEQYLQLKNRGKAPAAINWKTLKSRNDVHNSCVDTVTGILNNMNVAYTVIGREDMHRNLLQDTDLVVAVGGDGTVLSTSCFLDNSVPVLGVNSDPRRPEEDAGADAKQKDERRSRGALCATTSADVEDMLPRVVLGDATPKARTRIQCIVKSTYTETRLPPALNDVLVAHPSPAAVSRFRLSLNNLDTKYDSTFQHRESYPETKSTHSVFTYNCWSSGLWVSTATGSTAAMSAAGGHPMDVYSKNLQYMVREHLHDHAGGKAAEVSQAQGHGEITPEQMLHLHWNSQFGRMFVDGSHTAFDLTLGDDVSIESRGPELMLFESGG